jgi:hypothetical protein
MNQIPYSQAIELFEIDPANGFLRWHRNHPNPRRAGYLVGVVSNDAIYTAYNDLPNNLKLGTHRIIYLMQNGEWPAHYVANTHDWAAWRILKRQELDSLPPEVTSPATQALDRIAKLEARIVRAQTELAQLKSTTQP